MRIIKVLILCSFIAVLAGCSSTKELELINTPVERTKLELDNPPALQLGDIQWYVVTEDTIAEIFAELENQGEDVVLFAVTDKGYEVLAENQLKIRNYLREVQDRLQAYRDYYENNDGQEQ